MQRSAVRSRLAPQFIKVQPFARSRAIDQRPTPSGPEGSSGKRTGYVPRVHLAFLFTVKTMAYVVIARRWRPQQFDEIIGQEHVSKTLANSIANNHIAHSFIFTGPRGVGKTTTARILAKALNCEKGPTPTPCNECSSCKSITEGNSFDVLEIDGASNRGIDEIRNLRENIRFSPTTGKYRIYIIDEVHMLTKEAFNALLKTLEEPPDHAVFIFATTEIHKVPATILSRCQRFDFKRIPLNTIMEHLRHICQTDNVEIDEEALLQIAKKADGSMRDSQSILDQIISYSNGKITFDDVSQALGVIRQDIFFKTSDFIENADIKSLILLSNEILSTGYDLNEFLLGLEEHFRNILIVNTMQSTELIDVSENYLEQYKQTAAKFKQNDLIAYLQIISDIIKDIKWSKQPQLKLELGLIKLAKLPSSENIAEILSRIELLKKKALSNNQASAYGDSSPETQSMVAEKPLTLDEIKLKWNDIIDSIHTKKPTIASLLLNGQLNKFDADQLTLTVSEASEGLIKKNITLIEDVLYTVFQKDISVDFKYITSEKAETTAKNKGPTKKEIIDELEKIKMQDPLIKKFFDEFDLEPI